MRIAFLGLGRMGRLLAAHVARSGEHELTVWNRSPGKAGELVALGATEAPDVLEAVREAEVVCLMLTGPRAVGDVLPDVIAAASPGTLVLDLSTVGPSVARHTAARCSDAGLHFVDAPVAGSTGPAEKGELSTFLGGSDADVERVRPVVALWSDPQRVLHVGPVGSGSALKLVMNLSLGVAMAGLGEALRLAHDLALPEDITLTALSAGPLGWTLGQKRELLERGDYGDATFTLDLVAKDVDLCLAEARQDLPVVGAVRTEMKEAVAAGHGPDDYAALAGYLAGEGHPNSQ